MWEKKLSVIKFRLPAYFRDNMVLQQGVTNRILGQTKPNCELKVVLERYPGLKSEIKKKKRTQKKNPNKPNKDEYGIAFQSIEETDNKGFFNFK